MVGHQAHDRLINTHTAEVPRPIQWMETRLHQLGGVADVVQPCCRHKIISQCQLLDDPPRPPGYRPDVPPPARQGFSQHLPGQFSGFVNRDHILDRTTTAPASLPSDLAQTSVKA